MKTKTQKDAPVIDPEELEMDTPVCETEESASELDDNDDENVEETETLGDSSKGMFGLFKNAFSSLADEAEMEPEDAVLEEKASPPEVVFEHGWQSSLNRITRELREACLQGESTWSYELDLQEYQEMKADLAELLPYYPFKVSIEEPPSGSRVQLKADFESYRNPIHALKWTQNQVRPLEDRESWEESLDNLVNPLINFIGKVASIITKEESYEPLCLKLLLEDAYDIGIPLVCVIMDKDTFDEVKSFVQIVRHNILYVGEPKIVREGRVVSIEIPLRADASFAKNDDIPIYPMWNENFSDAIAHDVEKIIEHLELAISNNVTELFLGMHSQRYSVIKRKLAIKALELSKKVIIAVDEGPEGYSILQVKIF